MSYYEDMRKKASEDVAPITVRQFEGLERLTVARAKMLFKDAADADDAKRAISITDEMLKSSTVDLETGEVDMGVVRGLPTREAGARGAFLDLFRGLMKISGDEGVKESDMVSEMVKSEKWTYDAAKTFFDKVHQACRLIERSPGRYFLD